MAKHLFSNICKRTLKPCCVLILAAAINFGCNDGTNLQTGGESGSNVGASVITPNQNDQIKVGQVANQATTASNKVDAVKTDQLRANGFYRFQIGTLEAVVVSDGVQTDLPNDNKMFGVGAGVEAARRAVREQGLPENVLTLDFNALVVRTGDRIVLVDAGFGSTTPFGGKLVANLKRAEIPAEKVTDLIITHAHPDHIDGVIDKTGKLVFPNARHIMSDLEWRYLTGPTAEGSKQQAEALKNRITLVKPGAQILPGITSVEAPGHSPGQIALLIESNNEQLLYISDTAHHYVLSLAHPEWQVGTDAERAQGIETRRRLLGRAAQEQIPVLGYHFPFPGLGRVLVKDQGFEWLPSV